MTMKDFAGQGDALLTEPLRAYRSWTVKIELRDVRGPAARERERGPANSFVAWLDELYRMNPSLGARWHSRIYEGTDRRRYEMEERQRRGRPGGHDFARAWDDGRLEGKLMIPGTLDELTKMTLLPVNQTAGGAWRRDMKATCLSSGFHTLSHAVPEAGCTCGIYSWYRPQEASAEHTGILTGVISVLGKAVLGDRGIRSEKARLEAVTINSDLEHLLPFDRSVVLAGLRQEANRKGGPYEGMVVCDSEQELRRRYPPDLDTVANLLGRDVVDELVYNGRPLAGFAHRALSAHLVAGSTARRWGKTITGRFPSFSFNQSADVTRDDQEDPTP
jgi:hypothetical protein